MSNNNRELAATAIKLAKAAGASDCMVNVSNQRDVEIGYRELKPETIKESSTRYLELRLFVKGRYTAQGTSDLRPAALKSFIENAVAATKLLAKDPFRSLPEPKYYGGRSKVDLDLVDPGHAKLTPAERHAWAKGIEQACKEEGGDKLVSIITRVEDTDYEAFRMTSNGFEGSTKVTVFGVLMRATAQDEGDRRPNGNFYWVATHRKSMPTVEATGVDAAQRTLALLGARKAKTETLPIIIENRNVSRVLRGLQQAMNGRQVQQKQSFLADMKGKKVGSKLLTLVDDPFIPQGLGSRLFDNEGMAAKRRTMIDAGVLKDFWVSWYYSRKMGWEPTSNGPGNLVIPPGKRSVAEIMKDLGRGILITEFIGGNSNSTTGDSSVGIVGQLFDKGKIVHPVSEMNIAGNAIEFWSKLIEVANDPWPYSSRRMPSLVFKDVVVAGA